MPLGVYVKKGWEIVANGFKPFFPTLSTMSKADRAAVKADFFAKGTALGRSMMSTNQMVEDKHNDMLVTGIASKTDTFFKG